MTLSFPDPAIPIDAQKVYEFIGEHPNSLFFTITLKPKLYKYSSITQLELTNMKLFHLIYSCCRHYIVVAEHTKQGNVHYHAIVDVDDLSKMLLLNLLKKQKEFGFIKMDPNQIVHKKACAEYLCKSLRDNKKIFHASPNHKPMFVMTSYYYKSLYDN